MLLSVIVSVLLHGLLLTWLYSSNTDEIHSTAGERQSIEVTLVMDSSPDSRLQTKVEPHLLEKPLAEIATLSRLQQISSSAKKRIERIANAPRTVVADTSHVKSVLVEAIFPSPMLIQKSKPIEPATLHNSSAQLAEVSDSRPVQQDYLAKLRAAINRYKYYPTRARRLGKEGKVWVEFFIYRDGRIDQITIRESSGEPLLDRAARRSVRKLGIYQPFPDRLKASFLSVAVHMSYVMY